ncbi:hypothetical protein SteCoe_35201 [Stentor coeruleus]|uniref:Ricin B lectin domain-containing protein n=1 Tax=Stentor coeruleus TaxID=5963 RepID=A0A1R2ASU7_9CILI|nr:hypothetical protein SteCoe_35201 [Stentor coeruleus]
MESLSINNKCIEEECGNEVQWQCMCSGKYTFCNDHFAKHMRTYKCNMQHINNLQHVENQPVMINIKEANQTNLEFIPDPNCFYYLYNFHSGNLLNACGNDTGRKSCSMELNNGLFRTQRLWKFIHEADGTYRIMNLNSENILSSSGYGGTGSLIMQPNICSPFSQFRITSVPGYPNYYMIKNTYSGNCINSWDRDIGPGSATCEPDNDPTHPHRLWSFIKDNQ